MKLPRPAPRHLHALAAALLLGGCASMAPPFDPPPLPVPARYAEDTGPAGALPAADWRATFTDPQLQALIAQALANNRDLRTAVLRVEEARAAQGIQRADLFPTLGAQAGVDRVNTVGYCIGGTLLASTLAHMAARNDQRISSATFFAAQQDFA